MTCAFRELHSWEKVRKEADAESGWNVEKVARVVQVRDPSGGGGFGSARGKNSTTASTVMLGDQGSDGYIRFGSIGCSTLGGGVQHCKFTSR